MISQSKPHVSDDCTEHLSVDYQLKSHSSLPPRPTAKPRKVGIIKCVANRCVDLGTKIQKFLLYVY